jgi:hypothetical protein
MPTIQELERDPLFAKLSYEEQTQLRGEFFQQKVMPDPLFAQLPAPEQEQLFRETVNRLPILEQADSDFYRSSADKVLRMQLGDAAAVNEAVQMSALRTGTKQMLLPTIALKGADMVASVFDPERTDPFYQDYYGKDGTKVDQWLQKNIAQYGGPEALQKLQTETMAVGIVGGFAEFALMTMALGGIGGAIGKAAVAGIAGPGVELAAAAKAAAIGRGFLTGEALGASTRAALATTRLSSPLLKNLAVVTVEGLQSGVTQTGLDVLRMGLQDELASKKNDDLWKGIASEYGANVALNYVGWGAFKALGVIGKTIKTAVKGFGDTVTPSSLSEAFQAATGNPVTKALSPSYFEGTVAKGDALQKIASLDPKSETGFAIYAQAHGWDASFDNGKVTQEHRESRSRVVWPHAFTSGLSPRRDRRNGHSRNTSS